MTKRLIIYCEGQTEEKIVKRILKPHLLAHGVHVQPPILAATTQDPCGQRGGFTNWEAMQFDLRQIFTSNDSDSIRFTTLLDVYKMPNKVLALAGFSLPLTAVADIEDVERAMEDVLGEPRLRAYLQRHEIEALLLADMDALERVFRRFKPGLEQLRADIAGFANAEDINHGSETHPAARLAAVVPGYEDMKPANAYFVLAEAGLAAVRAKCPRFDAWLKQWEDWGA
jgi:hypothetical protein